MQLEIINQLTEEILDEDIEEVWTIKGGILERGRI
jgi:hypothetical protein